MAHSPRWAATPPAGAGLVTLAEVACHLRVLSIPGQLVQPAEPRFHRQVPGVDPDSLNLVVGERMLVIEGERRRPKVVGYVSYQQMEIEYGPFEREIVLALDVDTAAAHASYARGLLTIVLPLAKRPPRGVRVPIEVRTRP